MVQLGVMGVFLYVVLVPQSADFSSVSSTQFSSSIVRDGGYVSLSCKNVVTDPSNCDWTTWSYSQLARTAAVDLVSGRRISRKRNNNKSDRLSVTENCSLLIKNVTNQDYGRYFCIQDESERSARAVADVSVVTMTEQQRNGVVTLKCRLSTRLPCSHSVSWRLSGQDEDDRDIHVLESSCVAMLRFQTSHSIYTSRRYETLQCDLKEKSTNSSLQFILKPQSSGQTASGNTNTTAAEPGGLWWVYVIVAVGLAALCVISLFLIKRKRHKENKPQAAKHLKLNLNTTRGTSAQETSQDTDDLEDGVLYASVSLAKETTSKIRGGYNAVTYSTVKTSNTAAEPNNLYATII